MRINSDHHEWDEDAMLVKKKKYYAKPKQCTIINYNKYYSKGNFKGY